MGRAPLILVQRRMCATCIYRKPAPLDLAHLEAQVADRHVPGFFRAYRVCHHTADRDKICCAGFWRRHKDHFTLGQVAQRLKAVKRVVVDSWRASHG